MDAVTRARAGGTTVRALALTSPHNPLGRVYPADELAALAKVCGELDLDLVIDEIYANSVFGDAGFASALGLPGELRIHTVWGFAKDFGLPGFKVGVLHTRDGSVRAAARELAYFAPVSTDTQLLLSELLDDGAWVADFLRTYRGRLAASYAAATRRLVAAGIRYAPAQAGLSVWVDLRPWLRSRSFGAEQALWRCLMERGRVSMTPGRVFHSPEPGWFRLCHALDPAHVRTGIDRVRAVLSQ